MLTSTQGYSEDFSSHFEKYLHPHENAKNNNKHLHTQPALHQKRRQRQTPLKVWDKICFLCLHKCRNWVSENLDLEVFQKLYFHWSKTTFMCAQKAKTHRTKQAYFAKYLYADRGWVSQWSCDNLWAPFCQCWPWSSHSCDQLWPKHNHRCWNYNVHIRPKSKHHVKLFIQA